MSAYEIKTTAFELKSIDKTGIITGYGSVFDNIDNGGDIMMKGAFGRTLNKKQNVKMLLQHDPKAPIGIWTELSTDNHGLILKGQINMETQLGRETYSLLKMGALDGLSIGYIPIVEDYNKEGFREIKEVNLKEVSIVTFPMNEQATITAVKSEIPEMDVDQLKQVHDFIQTLLEPEKQQQTKKEVSYINDLSSLLDDVSNKTLIEDINTIIK